MQSFVALKDDGTGNNTNKVIVWGQDGDGGDITQNNSGAPSNLSSGITSIYQRENTSSKLDDSYSPIDSYMTFKPSENYITTLETVKKVGFNMTENSSNGNIRYNNGHIEVKNNGWKKLAYQPDPTLPSSKLDYKSNY